MNFLSTKKNTLIKNNSKLNKVIEAMLFIYVVIQPFLDTIYLFDERVINIFGTSPSTLIRFLFIFIIALLTLISCGFTKKFWLLVGYGGITVVYFVFHCINSLNLNTLYPDIASFSIINEAIYVCRFMIPAAIVYVASSIKLTENFFEKAIVTISATISGMIVITNLLGISLDSYTNEQISHNIFSWFTDAYTQNSFNGLASKAFFNFANMVSVICCMLLPIVIYFAMNSKPIYFILVLFHSVAMLMLGTKTSTYGVALILIAYMSIYLFLLLFKQCDFRIKKPLLTNLTSILIISAIVIGAILPVSPAIYRNRISLNYMQNFDKNSENNSLTDSETDEENDETEDSSSSNTESIPGKDSSNESDDSQTDINNPDHETDTDNSTTPINKNKLKDKLNSSGIISKFYINCYPYQYDLEFWNSMVGQESVKRLDSRFIEEAMLIRLKEINDNPLDDWLGITYDRTSRIYNLERDFLYQYYSMGIIGVLIFLVPYIFVLIYGIVLCLIRFKKLCNLRNVSMLLAIAIAIATAFYCGNTIDAPFANILLSFICVNTLLLFNTPENRADKNSIETEQ